MNTLEELGVKPVVNETLAEMLAFLKYDENLEHPVNLGVDVGYLLTEEHQELNMKYQSLVEKILKKTSYVKELGKI